jgi:Rap1a immunity proteins
MDHSFRKRQTMKRLTKTNLWLFGLVLCLCPQSFATKGNDLLDECQWTEKSSEELSPIQTTKSLQCTAYVEGVLDGVIFSSGSLCIPKDVTILQLGKSTAKYLRDHPEKLHEFSGLLVIEATRKAFPCK